MFWYILFGIVCFAWLVWAAREYLLERREYKEHCDATGRYSGFYTGPSVAEYVFISVFAIVISGMVTFILACISTAIFWAINPAYETTNYQIVSVSDSSKTEGSFFLGSGTIDQKPVYYYYGYDEYGNVARFWVYAESTGIKQDGGSSLDIIRPVPTNDWFQVGTFGKTRYVFHVPKGSVKENFNFDNE